ncbi:MAG: histidinol-phosphate transaminase, partial [Elusimicrobia bacterium]|nr:histidinol-phosphate transaminase [Elusimicrobiota bacterium]
MPIIEPRPQVRKFEPYLPGRSMEQVKKQYGLARVVKLASNENPLGPSRMAIQAMKKAAGQMHRYPDGFSTDLREAVAKHLGVKTSQVLLGAGSDELIELLGKAFLNPEDEIVVSEHAFIRYQMAGELMGARVTAVPMKNMTHDLAAMARAVTEKTKFVFIANPNNPTGTYNTAEELDAFLNALPAHAVAVLDEAYFEYARIKKDYPDSVELFKTGRNLIALRTFSKVHGLAGLRIGYGVAPESIAETVERVRPPFNVSAAAQAAAPAALKDKGQVLRSVRLVETEKRKMERAFSAMGVDCVPSAANFLLIHARPQNGADLCEALLQKGL